MDDNRNLLLRTDGADNIHACGGGDAALCLCDRPIDKDKPRIVALAADDESIVARIGGDVARDVVVRACAERDASELDACDGLLLCRAVEGQACPERDGCVGDVFAAATAIDSDIRTGLRLLLLGQSLRGRV